MSLFSAYYPAQDDRSPTHAPFHRHDLSSRDHRGRLPSWVAFEEGNALGLHHDHSTMAPPPPPPTTFKAEPVDLPLSFPPPMPSASSSSSGASYLPSPTPADYPLNSYGGQTSYFPQPYAAYPPPPPPPPHGFQYGADHFFGQRGPAPAHHHLPPLPSAGMDFPRPQRLPSAGQYSDYPQSFVGAPAWLGVSDRAALATPSERVYAGLPAQPSPAVVQPDAFSPSGEMTLSPAQDLHVQLPAHLHFLSLQPGHLHPAQQAGPSYFAPQPGGYLHQPMPSRAFSPPQPAFHDGKKEQFGLGISTVNAFGRSSPPPPPDYTHSRRPSSAASTSDGSTCNLSQFGLIDYSPRLPTFIKPLPECPESPPPASSPPPILRRIVALPLNGREKKGAGSVRSSVDPAPSAADAGAASTKSAVGKRTHSCEGCRKSKNKVCMPLSLASPAFWWTRALTRRPPDLQCDATPPAKGSGPAVSGCTSCGKKGILCEFLPLNKRGQSCLPASARARLRPVGLTHLPALLRPCRHVEEQPAAHLHGVAAAQAPAPAELARGTAADAPNARGGGGGGRRPVPGRPLALAPAVDGIGRRRQRKRVRLPGPVRPRPGRRGGRAAPAGAGAEPQDDVVAQVVGPAQGVDRAVDVPLPAQPAAREHALSCQLALPTAAAAPLGSRPRPAPPSSAHPSSASRSTSFPTPPAPTSSTCLSAVIVSSQATLARSHVGFLVSVLGLILP